MQLYRTLGIPSDADANSIRSAYRSLAKQYQPDVSKLPDAQTRFVAIAEAYQVLSNPETRTRYDRTWQRAAVRKTQMEARPTKAYNTNTQPRYDRSYSRKRHQARAQAEAFGKMPFAEFDVEPLRSMAGFVVPKILGCVGIGLIMAVVVTILLTLAFTFEALAAPILVLVLFGTIPGIVFASTKFDIWHDQLRMRRKRQRR